MRPPIGEVASRFAQKLKDPRAFEASLNNLGKRTGVLNTTTFPNAMEITETSLLPGMRELSKAKGSSASVDVEGVGTLTVQRESSLFGIRKEAWIRMRDTRGLTVLWASYTNRYDSIFVEGKPERLRIHVGIPLEDALQTGELVAPKYTELNLTLGRRGRVKKGELVITHKQNEDTEAVPGLTVTVREAYGRRETEERREAPFVVTQ